jgi:hypothetical protein
MKARLLASVFRLSSFIKLAAHGSQSSRHGSALAGILALGDAENGMKPRRTSMTAQSQTIADRIDRPAANSLLTRALRADSLLCGVAGIAIAAAAGPLSALFSLPTAAVAGIGIGLLAYAGLLWWEIGALPIRKVGWAVAIINLIWVAASAALLLSGYLPFMSLAWWIVLDAAIIVDLFATVQIVALTRRAPRA